MCSCFGKWEKYEGEKCLESRVAAKDGQSMECYANNGNSGVQNLLSQLTELTTSLCIFDKQWHTCL